MLVSALRLTLTLVLMDYEKARSRDGAYGLCALIDCSGRPTDLLEGIFICDVVDKDGPVAVPVVNGAQGVEPLLTRRVLSAQQQTSVPSV